MSEGAQIVGDWTGKLAKELNPNNIPEGVLCENIKCVPLSLALSKKKKKGTYKHIRWY
jgi:hypothetical protein